jgi:hypothetical protein
MHPIGRLGEVRGRGRGGAVAVFGRAAFVTGHQLVVDGAMT